MREYIKRRRTNFSIKRQMQFRLLLKILSIFTAGIAIMAVIFFWYSNRKIGGSFQMFHVHARNFLDYLWLAIVSSFGVSFVISLIISLFFPHKIAGPLYRIERDLKEKIGEGDFSVRFHLRKGDEMSDLATAINTMLDKLSNTVQHLQRRIDELESLVDTLPKDDQKDISRLVKELSEELRKFKIKT